MLTLSKWLKPSAPDNQSHVIIDDWRDKKLVAYTEKSYHGNLTCVKMFTKCRALGDHITDRLHYEYSGWDGDDI